jgi:hypothetical protein
VPLEVLWGGQKETPRLVRTAPAEAGTTGNRGALSEKPAPASERRLLQVLSAGGEFNSLILSTLNDDWLTDPRVARIVKTLRKAPPQSESVDFHAHFADLTEEDRTFLSGVALEEFSEPTEKGVDQLLKTLEVGHLKGESAALYGAIKQREAEGGSEIDELIRMKQEKDRRIAKLTSRKGLTVGH